MTELEQFALDLHQEVLTKCADDAAPQLREDSFSECVLERLAEHNEADYAEICYHAAVSRGRWPAAKINAWALSGDGATLDLFVTLYIGNGQTDAITKSEVARYFGLARGFLRRALDGVHTQLEEAHEVFEAARRIHEAKGNLASVRLFFLTDGVVATRATEVEQEQLPGLEVRYVLWDLEKLSRLRVGQREVIDLDFAKHYGGPVSCISVKDVANEYTTFLAFLPAPQLAKIYGEHGQRLLERNVRAFLQAKGKINKGLQHTLRDEPHRFLAYNNGLCCTAAEVDVEVGKAGHAQLKRAKDFQIVNGGQTTASIFHAWKKDRVDISGVVVQVKLTVLTEPAKVADIVPLISKYANSQNKVNTADFSANGMFHRNLEQLSRTVWAPAASGLERGTHWYYERARGSYLDDKSRHTPARMREWEKQNPPRQKFTKTDLAKFEHAWMGLPYLVCMGAEKNFNKFAERMEDDGEPLVDQNHFKHSIARAILWRTTEKIFDTLDLEGYRAQSVAYSIAWMAEWSKRCIDLNRVWNEQRLSPALCEALKFVCGKAHGHISSQEGNPGEASKKEFCWREFRETELSEPSEWLEELSETAFLPATTEVDALLSEWERIRHAFINDQRSIEELEVLTAKEWVVARRHHAVTDYAEKTWEQLRGKRGMGLRKIRGLVELLSAAMRQ